MKFVPASQTQKLKCSKQRLGIFFVSQTPDVEQQLLVGLDSQRLACGWCIIRCGVENFRVHPKPYRPDIVHAPFRKEVGQSLRRDERGLKAVIEFTNISAR